MLLSNANAFPFQATALSTYITKRKEIITLIRSINTKLDFNSQTFFLAVYYMDEIFTSTHFTVDPDISNYILLSLCCLIISSKFNENDPKVPDIYKYINICTETTKYKYLFSIDDIRNGEVFILQKLQYKLNYFSVYHYIVFFFAHGVIFKRTYERSEVKHANNGVTKKKLLERIYIHSREILDYYLEDDNEFCYCNCKYNYLIAVVVLWKVTENVLKVNLNDNENVYKLIYGIEVEDNEVYRDICCKVERIYESKVLKRKGNKTTTTTGVNGVNVNSPKELNHSEIKTPTSSKNTNRYSYVQQQQNYFTSGISRLRLGEDGSMKVKALSKVQQKKQSSNGSTSSNNNNNMQMQSNMSLSTSGFDKIKNDFTGNKIDLLKIHMKKRACSTNKETSRFINNTNNININDLPIQNSNNNNNTMNTNLNNSRIDHNNIISQQTSPSIHPPSNTNSTIKSNEILYHKYIGITKPPLSKTEDYTPATTTSSHTNNNININTTYTSNNRQLYPNNILDKTKKIFDQAKSIKAPYNTIINTQQIGLTYTNNNSHLRNIPRASNVDSNYSSNSDLYNNYNSNNVGNTIIINNNININAYIDKKGSDVYSNSNDNHYYYNNYESYNSYNKGRRDERYMHSVNNFNSGINSNSNSNHQQGKFGKFGTYYDYGYGYSGYKGMKGGKYTGYEYY